MGLGRQRSEREAPSFRARLTVAKEKGKGKMSSGEEGREVEEAGREEANAGKRGGKKARKSQHLHRTAGPGGWATETRLQGPTPAGESRR